MIIVNSISLSCCHDILLWGDFKVKGDFLSDSNCKSTRHKDLEAGNLLDSKKYGVSNTKLAHIFSSFYVHIHVRKRPSQSSTPKERNSLTKNHVCPIHKQKEKYLYIYTYIWYI